MNGGREGVTGMHPVVADSALTPFFFLNTGEIPNLRIVAMAVSVHFGSTAFIGYKSQILVVFLHTISKGKH